MTITTKQPTVLDALIEIRDRIKSHPMYASLTLEEEENIGGDTAEFSYLVRIADAAIDAASTGESNGTQ